MMVLDDCRQHSYECDRLEKQSRVRAERSPLKIHALHMIGKNNEHVLVFKLVFWSNENNGRVFSIASKS